MIARKYAAEESFVEKCHDVGIKHTKRQASKFLRGKGAVYQITVKKMDREKIHIPQSAREGQTS